VSTELSASTMDVRQEVKRHAERAIEEAKFYGWTLTREGRANVRRLGALKGRYRGRRCFVMGNGPSLLKCDLNRLESEVTIVSNAHYLIWDQLTYTPTFLAVEDWLVAEDRAYELSGLAGTTKIFPFDLRPLLGSSDEAKLYLNFPRNYRPFPKFSNDLAKRCFWGGTVSFLNLQLAAYLGCDPIILIGFDHSYSVPSGDIQNNVIESKANDINHIHPDYFGPGYRWHDPNISRMEVSYRYARDALERAGVRVLNATVEGHLETFERVSFDAVV
jgi:hypothetical protein